jgi:hypothetical protein
MPSISVRAKKSTQVTAEHTNEIELNICKILFGKPEGKRPLGPPGYRRDDYQKLTIRNRVSL